MARAAPFGSNKVIFLSHVVRTNGPVFPGKIAGTTRRHT